MKNTYLKVTDVTTFPWCRLVFNSSDDDCPGRPSNQHHHSSTNDRGSPHRRAEASYPEHHTQYHYLTSTPITVQFSTADTTFSKDSTEEIFPTATLDDDVWTEDPEPDGQLCIHDTPQLNHQCSYPCPYRNLNFEMDLPQSQTPEAVVFGYEIMDLSAISSDLCDIMTTTSDKDILDPEDISDCLDSSQHEAWFA